MFNFKARFELSWHSNSCCLVWLVLFFLFPNLSNASENVELKFKYLYDHENSFELSEIYEKHNLHRFQHVDSLNFGRASGTIWLAIDVPRSLIGKYFVPSYFGFEEFSVYELVDESSKFSLVRSMGIGKIPSWQQHKMIAPQFQFELTQTTMLLKLKSPFAMRVPYQVLSANERFIEAFSSNQIFQITLGFLLCVVFYGFLMTIVGKKASFLFFAMYLLFVKIFLISSLMGFTAAFIPTLDTLNYQFIILLSSNLGFAFLGLFALEFLPKELIPRLRYTIKFLSYSLFALSTIYLVLPKENAYFLLSKVFNLMVIILQVAVLVGMASVMKKIGTPAYFFFGGLISFLFGVTCYMLHINNIVNLGVFGENVLFIFPLLETTLLSIALSIRIRDSEQEKEEIMQEEVINRKFRTFVNILCHDLSNAVMKIQFCVSKGKRKLIELPNVELVAPVIPLMDKTNGAIENITGMIENVRDMQSFALGKKKIKLVKVDCNDAIIDTISRLQHRLIAKDIKVHVKSQKGINVLALTNEKLLIDSIMVNILSNAIKFSEKGSRIDFSILQYEGYGYIEIRDYGLGIPDEILKNLFRDDKETSRAGTSGESGTGFGMPIAKEMIANIGGSIAVKTSTEKGASGTAFSLAVPIWKPSDTLESRKNQQSESIIHKSKNYWMEKVLKKEVSEVNQAEKYFELDQSKFEMQEELLDIEI